jgi:ketosteroid isomerase-like protein
MLIPYSSQLLLVLCVTAMTMLGQAQVASADNESKHQIAQLEREWLKADGSGDTARLQQIIADDFVGIGFNGRLLNKEDIIPQVTGRPGGFAGATPGDSNVVRLFGDTGILIGIINPAKPDGKQIRVTLVCQKQPRGWRIIAAKLTGT